MKVFTKTHWLERLKAVALLFFFLFSLTACPGNGLFGPQTPGSSGNAGSGISDSIVIPSLTSLGLNRPSIAADPTPLLNGISSIAGTVQVFAGTACSGSVLGTDVLPTSGTFSIPLNIPSEGSYQFSLRWTGSTGQTVCTTQSLPYTLDQSGPAVTLSAPSVSLLNQSASVTFIATYAEASSISLTPSQILIDSSTAVTCTKTISVINSTSASITLSNCTGDGNLHLRIAAGSAADSAGNSAQASAASAAFTLDNTGFSTATILPAGGNFSVLPSTLEIALPGVIDASSVSPSDFSLSGTCMGTNISQAVVSGSSIFLTLTGVSACTLSQTIIVTTDLTGIRDAAGNSGSGWIGTTYRLQNVGPTSVTFIPSSGTRATIPAAVAIITNTPADPMSVDMSDFTLGGTCVGTSLDNVSVSGTRIDVSLLGTAACANNDTLNLGIDLTGITDNYGNMGSGSASLTINKDSVGPAVTINTAGGSYSSLPTSLQLTFSSDTDMDTVRASRMNLTGSCSGVSLGAITKSSNVVTVNLSGTSSCVNGQTIGFQFDNTYTQDLVGNWGTGTAAVTLSLDTVGPLVTLDVTTATLPLLPSIVVATFTSDTDMSTVTSADFSLSGSCSGASIQSLVKVGNLATLTLNGTGTCLNGQNLVLQVDLNGVVDTVGNAGNTTVTATLSLDSIGPSGLLNILTSSLNPLPSAVTVTFDADTDMSTVDVSDFGLTGTCLTAGIGSLAKSGKTATVNLTGTPSCASLSTVILTLDLSLVKDLTGNSGVGSQVATYLYDNVGPVASLSLNTGHYNPLPTFIDVTFSADTNMNSVTAADFTIGGLCIGISIGSVVKTGQVARVNFAGTSGCVAVLGTMILTTNLVGVTDLIGNAGIGTQVGIYTYDALGPTVSYSIGTGNRNPLPTSVVVTFSPDTDMSSVDASSFILTGTCLSAAISSVSKTGTTATVNFSGTASCGILSTMIFTTSLGAIVDQIGNLGLGVYAAIWTKL